MEVALKKIGKVSLISMLVSAIVGCNTDNSENDNDTTNNTGGIPSTIQYTAIDGYLVNAEVYADRNGDEIASSDEFIGTTDKNGNVAVNIEDVRYAIIVKVIAGVTTDTDVDGPLTSNRELIAPAGTDVISPFSTIAYANDMSLSELAGVLNIESGKISGDFIAEGHEDVHMLSRSLYQMMNEDLSSELGDINERLQQAEKLANYAREQSEASWGDVILGLDENNNVIVTTVDDANKTLFDWSKATVQWEQTNFDDHLTFYGDTFHPCYPHKWTDDLILVGNCRANYFISLDVQTGEIVNYIDLEIPNANQWYFDEQSLTIVTDEGTTHYNTDFKPLEGYTPTDIIRISGDGYNISVQFAGDEDSEVDYGDGISIDGAFSDEALLYTDTIKGAWKADGVAFRTYDSDDGTLFSIMPNMDTLETEFDDGETIMAAVAKVHNDHIDNGLYPGAEYASSLNDSMYINYISKKTFLVRVDSDRNPNYVTNDYHYFYRDGVVTTLGQFMAGDWYKGLDNSTVTWYTSARSHKDVCTAYDDTEEVTEDTDEVVDGATEATEESVNDDSDTSTTDEEPSCIEYASVFAEPHEFKQFDINSGELVGQWVKSHDEFEPVLYSQQHVDFGVISTSDTYSSVSLIK